MDDRTSELEAELREHLLDEARERIAVIEKAFLALVKSLPKDYQAKFSQTYLPKRDGQPSESDTFEAELEAFIMDPNLRNRSV